MSTPGSGKYDAIFVDGFKTSGYHEVDPVNAMRFVPTRANGNNGGLDRDISDHLPVVAK